MSTAMTDYKLDLAALRLARELRVWAGLRHAHILPLLGYFLDKDYKEALLISEYMIYGDLKDYITQKKPAWDTRLQLIRDTTEGLAYLHGKKPPILHGDLKPRNVLINAERRAMLADFGLSKALKAGPTGLTTSIGIKATLRYASPELMSESDPDRCLPSDIWAWACLALEAWTDRVPYGKKSTEYAVLFALVKGECPSDTKSLPIPVPDLKLLLTECWSVQPDKRPSAAYCLQILNSVSPVSKTGIGTEDIAAEESSTQPDLQPTGSSVGSTTIRPGAPPQNNADKDSRNNGKESKEEGEDANPLGTSEDDSRGSKTLQAVKPESEDTVRAVGSSLNSVPSQLSPHVPQQGQASDRESEPQLSVGSTPIQPAPSEPLRPDEQAALPIVPSHERSKSLIALLNNLGFPLDTYPFLAQVIEEELGKNLTIPDAEILSRIIGRVQDGEITPTTGQPEPPNTANEGPLHDFRPGPEAPGPSTHRAPRGRTERLIDKLEAMGFSVSKYPRLPQVAKEESRKHIFMPEEEVVPKILERIVKPDNRPTPATRGGPSKKGPLLHLIVNIKVMNDRELDFTAQSGAPPQNNTSGDTQQNVVESGEAHVTRDDLDSRSTADEILQATPDSRPSIKWVRGELIGKGGYGNLYLAFNITTGEMMAVRQANRIQPTASESDVRNDQAIEAERRILEKLDHPNIIQYLGFEKTEEFLNLFLEYVPGGSLGSCLGRFGAFKEDIVKSFTGQIVDGLVYLHANRIIHKDIKADNILVDPSGNCKINGFECSEQQEEIYKDAEMTAMQGSLFWMAPEMLHSDRRGYSAKVDIWSLGCTLLEMLSGKRPWWEDDFVSVMFKVGHSKMAPPVPSNMQFSTEADDFRLKCFTMNPDERPTAEGLRSHPWLTLPPGWTFNGFH
ncbi:hypothetical protein FRC05_001408 [Tulasnella sp. 425]|nr:hypothetical protein FRC05_001408 [Tulasnella sp. 425]